jgi:ribosomal protein L40E
MVFLFKRKKKAPAAPSKPIKFCKGCGVPLPIDALHCTNCGHREKICKSCGKGIPLESIRCMYCSALQ